MKCSAQELLLAILYFVLPFVIIFTDFICLHKSNTNIKLCLLQEEWTWNAIDGSKKTSAVKFLDVIFRNNFFIFNFSQMCSRWKVFRNISANFSEWFQHPRCCRFICA